MAKSNQSIPLPYIGLKEELMVYIRLQESLIILNLELSARVDI